MPGHVGDDPADRVARLRAPAPIRLAHAPQATPELGAGEPELLDERDTGDGRISWHGASVGPGAAGGNPVAPRRIEPNTTERTAA